MAADIITILTCFGPTLQFVVVNVILTLRSHLFILTQNPYTTVSVVYVHSSHYTLPSLLIIYFQQLLHCLMLILLRQQLLQHFHLVPSAHHHSTYQSSVSQ